jgi:NADPH2:quinone reductase
MRAVVLRAFGGPDGLRIEEVAEPAPGPGQVVVDVEVASITFVETQVRGGRPPNPAMLPALPVVLGNGVGGTVAAVGPDVDSGLLGLRVVTTTGGSGGYAERVAVDVGALLAVPDGVSTADATALLADGRTAIGLADAARLRAGDRVLVEAAAGGVGSLLVQLAAAAGATVIGVAGSGVKTSAVRELPADLVVDYSGPAWTDRVRDALGGVDVVFDGVGGLIGAAALTLVADDGRFVPFGMASGAFTQLPEAEIEQRRIAVVRFVPRGPEEMHALSSRALQLAADGLLRPIIGQTFPLERAADAHAAIEARSTIGKTLLVVG